MAKAQIEMTATPATPEQDIVWLRVLEEKVHAAAGRIRELREENALLLQRVEDLEERLATPVTAEAAGRWAEEREEICGRVARLVQLLEGLTDA